MKLIDMGTAKFLKGISGKTFTIIGNKGRFRLIWLSFVQ